MRQQAQSRPVPGTIHIDEIRSIAREHNGVTFLGVRSVTQSLLVVTAVRCIMSSDDEIKARVPSHPKAASNLLRLRHLPLKRDGAS